MSESTLKKSHGGKYIFMGFQLGIFFCCYFFLSLCNVKRKDIYDTAHVGGVR